MFQILVLRQLYLLLFKFIARTPVECAHQVAFRLVSAASKEPGNPPPPPKKL